MSDFKTNEYAQLIGGRQFEPQRGKPHARLAGGEPLLQRRATARASPWSAGPSKRSGRRSGLDNVIVMIPFCRTLEEADRVLETLAENGLMRGEHGLQVYVMCEIPSNVILARRVRRALRRLFHRQQRPDPA